MLPERKKATLFLVLIFLCGLVGGAVSVNVWQKLNVAAQTVPLSAQQSTVPPLDQPPAPGTPSRGTLRAVESFTKRLNLKPDQAEQLTQILMETRNAYRQHEREIASIRQQGNTRIREILSDTQKVEFDQMVARAEEKRKRDKR
jgi:NADH dehydrogenase/NADH:ubiquinone oxidoreductase subunit G